MSAAKIEPLSLDRSDLIIDLLKELFSFYNPTASITDDDLRHHLSENLLSASSGLELIVASEEGGSIIGFAAIGFIHSVVDPRPLHSKQCFLKELYVSKRERSRGIGLQLMQWIADYAISKGGSRIDWPVKADNSGDIKFYESLGAERVEDRLSYRLSGASLAQLADAKLRHRGQIGS
ncbi:MAG: GNAT family N-acetyltransferase [Henriciella sp.]